MKETIPFYRRLKQVAAFLICSISIALFCNIGIVHAQTTVQGTVTDKNGAITLPGTTVRVKGSAVATTTNNEGRYSIVVPAAGVLQFNLIGYSPVEVAVQSRKIIDVQLVTSESTLNDVVVVGYGTQKKINLTGAVATISSEKLENRPMVNLADGLQGLLPGLNINLNNGQPGQAASFNVRGNTTISAGGSSAPLILVDGVVRDPNLIDPNDVATVTVLKDAASSAIYGSRAANGVIIITTKSGKKGQTQLAYSGAYTISRPTLLPDYVNSGDYIAMFNSAQRTGQASGGYTSGDPFTAQDSTRAAAFRADPVNNPSAYVDPGNPRRYRYVGNTDWIDILYPGWAPQQQHNLSLSGGENKTTYVASLGYFRQEGLQKPADQIFQRFTPNLKITSDVTSWLTVGVNTSLTHTDNNQGAFTRINQGGSWISGDLRPLMPVYHPDGNFSGQGNYTNPIAVLTNSGRDIDAKNDFFATGRVIIRPAKNITVNSDYTWNSFTSFRRANLIPYNEFGVNGAFLNIFPWTNPSQVNETRQNNNYNAFNAYATYENTFASKHYFKATAGYNQEYQHYQLSNSLARNLIDPTLPAIGLNNDTRPVVGGTETQFAIVGTFFRLNYIFNDRYLLEVNGRYDGTSRFQPTSRYTFSPSVSAGWNISQEGFMESIKKTVNLLKLRVSYGQLPNQLTSGSISSAAQYPYIATQTTGTVGYLFGGQPGIVVNTPGLISPNFTWEKVQTQNIGLDFGILNNRLSGSLDYFINNTRDMLVPGLQLPAVLGTSAPASNSADLRTKGWEASLTWADKAINKELSYSIAFNISDSYSRITKFKNNPTNNLGNLIEGERLGDIYGFETVGFYQTDAEAASVNNSQLAGYRWLAGDVKYADLNGDGKIDYGNQTISNSGDFKKLGNGTPRYRFGLNINLAYKNVDFTAFVQGVMKQDYMPSDYVFYAFKDDEYSIPFQDATDYWTSENRDAYFARPRFAGGGNVVSQTKYMQNAAYARLKQLTLGYTFPKLLTDKIKLQRLRVYATGANLFTITSLYKGYDPEVLSYTTYPLNRSLSFGLQVTL